ncbi:MAG: F0F1 ATP synthase subunit B [Bacteroidales bacterium]|jgi:F-type H+-transporting ATPase subunit b|nr:F0F1 ATP synthase subunit B [Bacteroidales bacterium]NLH23318.1 F0F1 ATP synthase subunit B [Bacteroidales bacterium]HPJ82860.1 F0F1 ATP synthase subunit B [Bacteroidales bacterium]
MDLMIPDSGLLFWMLIAFGILFFVLARFGWPLITGVVERRNERIAKALSDAAAARQLLATLKLQEEKIMQQSRDEQARLVEQTEALRIKLTDQAREAAQEESRIILEKAREQIQKEKEVVMQELRLYVASLSVEVAEKVLRKQLERDSGQMELINQLIDESLKPRA